MREADRRNNELRRVERDGHERARGDFGVDKCVISRHISVTEEVELVRRHAERVEDERLECLAKQE